MKNKIFCGFSANPEVYFGFNRKSNGKHEIDEEGMVLSGSSINIAKCLQNMGHNPHALILTGPKNGLLSTFQYNALVELLYNESIPYTHFEVLNSPSFCYIPIDKDPVGESELYGKKKINPDKLKDAYSALDSLNEDIRWVALSGVKLQELALAKLVLKRAEVGKRLLMPKPELIASPQFEELLRDVDLLVMNKIEFASYHSKNIEDLHQFGPKFIIITDSANGGYFSSGKGVTHYEAYPSQSHKYSKVGAGDWSAGAIISWVLEQGLQSFVLDQEQAIKATAFAAQVSAKKLNYQGGSIGPTREDIITD